MPVVVMGLEEVKVFQVRMQDQCNGIGNMYNDDGDGFELRDIHVAIASLLFLFHLNRRAFILSTYHLPLS